jgi:hypothetical protein
VPGSIAFVVVTSHEVPRALAILDTLQTWRHADDEFILLTRAGQAVEGMQRRPWLKMLQIDAADVIELRRHMPTISKAEWLFLLEDHSVVDQSVLAAIRTTISKRRDIDLVAILAKNLTSTSAWDWASFLHGLSPVWPPLKEPPPFALATSAVVRSVALGARRPLAVGEWEFQVVPRLYASGRYAYSDEIYIDHISARSWLGHMLIGYINTRACAAIHRRLGMSKAALLREAWSHIFDYPSKIAPIVARRQSELPSGTMFRIRILAGVLALGIMMGAVAGAGRLTHKL